MKPVHAVKVVGLIHKSETFYELEEIHVYIWHGNY